MGSRATPISPQAHRLLQFNSSTTFDNSSRKFGERFSKRAFTEKDHPFKSFGFQAQHEPLQVSVAIGTLGRQQNGFYLGTGFEKLMQRRELGIAVHEDVSGVSQESLLRIGEVPSHLPNPGAVWAGGDSGNLDAASLQLHDDEYEERYEPVLRPNFGRREVDGGERIPVSLEKRSPRGRAFPIRSWLNANTVRHDD